MGEIFYSTVEEEDCMGGLRYSGMKDRRELPKNMQSGSFLVPAGVIKVCLQSRDHGKTTKP